MDNEKVYIGLAVGVVVLLLLFRSSGGSNSASLSNLNTSGLTTQAETTAQQNANAVAASLDTAEGNSKIAIINAQTAATVNQINTQSQLQSLVTSAQTLYTPTSSNNRGGNGGYATPSGNTLADVLNYFTTILPGNTQLNLQQTAAQNQINDNQQVAQYQLQNAKTQASNTASASNAACNGFWGGLGCGIKAATSIFGLKL